MVDFLFFIPGHVLNFYFIVVCTHFCSDGFRGISCEGMEEVSVWVTPDHVNDGSNESELHSRPGEGPKTAGYKKYNGGDLGTL